MIRILATLATVLALSACVTTMTPNVLAPQQLRVAANSFDALESTATNYLKLPLCGTVPVCRSQTVSVSLVKAVRSARSARTQLEAYVNANPTTPIPATLYQTVSVAVTTLQSILVSNNIN